MPTKKIAPKKVVTGVKSTSKKSPRKRGRRVLTRAHNDQCFWTTDGKIVADLIELRDLLEKMDTKVFAYHANKEKNDFADWVEQVLGDADLAKTIRRMVRPTSACSAVVTRLKLYDI